MRLKIEPPQRRGHPRAAHLVEQDSDAKNRPTICRSMREHMLEITVALPAERDAESSRLALLRLLAKDQELSQRGLSQALGVSLGKTHYVLHALLDRGLVKASNFRRNDRKLAYVYLLTPAGLREKVRLTRAFLARKEAEFESIQETIAALRREVASAEDHAERP